MNLTLDEKVSKITNEDQYILDAILTNASTKVKQPRKFDFDECLNLMPWEKSVIENDIEKQWKSGQLKFKGTVVAKTARIKIVSSRQPRAQKVAQKNAKIVGNSLEVNNWISKLPRIIVIESDDPNYDYELLLGFTRHQEITRLLWEEIPVDVVSAPPLTLAEIASDTNLHIGKQGKPNTPESIWNLALKAVKNNWLSDDDKIVKAWIFERARDKTELKREEIFKKYKLRRPSTDVMQTFHQDKTGENSIKIYCKNNEMLTEKNGEIGIVRGDGDSASGWNTISQKILEKPYVKKIWGMWVPEPNQKTLSKDRKNQLKKAKNFHEEKAKLFVKVYKLIKEAGGDPLKIKDIIKYGFNIEYRHVAQDTSPDPSKGGEPKEKGWVNSK